jgi:hypothetical protein
MQVASLMRGRAPKATSIEGSSGWALVFGHAYAELPVGDGVRHRGQDEDRAIRPLRLSQPCCGRPAYLAQQLCAGHHYLHRPDDRRGRSGR